MQRNSAPLWMTADSQDTCDIYAARGDNVSVPLGPGRTLNDFERLKWTYNNDLVLFTWINKKIVRGKKEDIHENGSLWLKSVTVSNNGAYKPEIQDAKRFPKPSHASDTMEWLKNDKVEAKYKGEWKVTKEAKQVQSDSFRCKRLHPTRRDEERRCDAELRQGEKGSAAAGGTHGAPKHRSKRDPQQKPRVPEGHPEPSPRRAAQVPRPAQAVDEEQPPPLPQPRKKDPRAQRV
ncbi:hypothetical protein KUCAC02_001052 [Chaenocephalus aceratus]|uniref:Uncharacterized protein n=1 Tax=Chaenocephalus aceratus TaxID=36190 RepID=A0ACB9XVU2_CHAAC|nr:hypothetical protein KUCAC02_001052 [Chaenocephalus aceratus]